MNVTITCHMKKRVEIDVITVKIGIKLVTRRYKSHC